MLWNSLLIDYFVFLCKQILCMKSAKLTYKFYPLIFYEPGTDFHFPIQTLAGIRILSSFATYEAFELLSFLAFPPHSTQSESMKWNPLWSTPVGRTFVVIDSTQARSLFRNAHKLASSWGTSPIANEAIFFSFSFYLGNQERLGSR